jgi:crossover junction endodeoxyribonuclease RusA
MEVVKVTLPYPPSVNRYLRFSQKGWAYTTKEAKQYKQGAKLRALTQGMRPILDGEVSLLITVFRPRKTGDLDNHLKVLLDSLNGVAYADDKQVAEIFISRFEDAANPRVEVRVMERKSK